MTARPWSRDILRFAVFHEKPDAKGLLSSIQCQAYILDVHVRCTTSETFYSVKFPLHGQATTSIDRGKCRLAAVHAPFFFLSRQTPFETFKLNAVDRTNSAEVDRSVNFRFEGDLQQALEESLSLFPVVQLKAEQRFIIEKTAGREMFSSN